MQARSAPILSPSDIERSPTPVSGVARVGGRIHWIEARQCLLADAFGQIRLHFEYCEPLGLAAGDLVEVEVEWVENRWTVLAIERNGSFAEPRRDDEWSRFVWSGKARRLQQRDHARGAARSWFARQGFLEVETPTWLSAPGLDSDVEPIAAERGWLVTSPELCMKRLLVAGLPRVFQFAKCFRRDEMGPRHEPEFTMLEWYRAFSDLAQMLEDTEELVMAVAEAVGSSGQARCGGRTVQLERPFLRLTVAEAFRRHAGEPQVHELAKRDRSAYFQLFVDRVEPALAEYDRPLFLLNYPATEAALARLCPEDPRWAERAELYLGGVELCNAYSELSSASEQRARFEAELCRRKAAGDPTYPLDEHFLAALSQGMPPSAGNALGFDRLLMLLLGTSTIGDVIAFPRNEL